MRIAALLSDFKVRRLTPDSERQPLGGGDKYSKSVWKVAA